MAWMKKRDGGRAFFYRALKITFFDVHFKMYDRESNFRTYILSLIRQVGGA